MQFILSLIGSYCSLGHFPDPGGTVVEWVVAGVEVEPVFPGGGGGEGQ